MTSPTTQRLPLRRPTRGRMIGGVCAGLAAHFNVSVGMVRFLMVIATLAFGVGALFYVWLWITVPVGDPADAAMSERPAVLNRLVPPLGKGSDEWAKRARSFPIKDVAVGVLLLLIAGLILLPTLGVSFSTQWLLPVLIAIGGIALAWSQLDVGRRRDISSSMGGRTPTTVLWILGGLALVLVGVVMLIGQNQDLSVVWRAVVAGIAVLAGAILVFAPWFLRLINDLGAERTARARESERADIAAHLHDSVLQTLAVIRRSADDPDAVRRLTRSQERELRTWLYEDRPVAGESIAMALKELAADIEDDSGIPIDVVTVGDCPPNENLDALLKAIREALINATRHGRPPISVYLEVRDSQVEVTIRDRGDGFTLDTVPEDRLGVRESVMGRVQRRGGEATIRSTPDGVEGTEIRLTMPIQHNGRVKNER